MSASSQLENFRDFRTIYPLYINSNRTQQQGRKIAKDKSISDPTIDEIVSALSKIQNAKVIVELEKRHPKEFNFEQKQFNGRVRVCVPPNNNLIQTKLQLLVYVANEISKMDRKKIKYQVPQVLEQSEQPQTTTKKSTGNRKKNNRKR